MAQYDDRDGDVASAATPRLTLRELDPSRTRPFGNSTRSSTRPNGRLRDWGSGRPEAVARSRTENRTHGPVGREAALEQRSAIERHRGKIAVDQPRPRV